jgi:hypothetical protein
MPELNSYKANRKRTICEVHREMYDILIEIENTGEAIKLLQEAFDMAKRMNEKLIEYGFLHERYSDINPNYKASLKKRTDRGLNGRTEMGGA